MHYEIIISPRVVRDMKKLPREITTRIFSSLEKIQEDPIQSVYRLQDCTLYSLHIGEYRVILDILPGKLVIIVVRVGHRRNVYTKI